MITANEYKERRKKLMISMEPNSVAIIKTSPHFERTFDTNYKFRPRSGFYYLTGITEPHACAVFIPGRESGEYIIFCKESDPERTAWLGEYTGPKKATSTFDADEAYNIEEIDNVLPTLLFNKIKIYYSFDDEYIHSKITYWIHPARMKIRKGIISVMQLQHIESLLQDLRLYKSEHELQLLQTAINITTQGIIRAMQTTSPHKYEYELEAELVHEFITQGAEPAFQCMISAGVNRCLSHYKENNMHKICDGDIIIIDVGAEFQYYTADLSRTFPANGKFSTNQKKVYNLVLAIQTELINMIKPGVSLGDLQDIIPLQITQGLLNIGVLKGNLSDLLEKQIYKKFFMHNIGHWLGLDIHDEASYALPDKTWRKLLPGMVLTIEPGIYIRNDTPEVHHSWWNIGARIEDNILVTRQGCEVLSKALPKKVEEIEAIMADNRVINEKKAKVI